ncbi:dihydroxyacetone phosphate acyltransferase [Cephus cinctus]|uniref:Dihydroxyacetone phosphate acyltransferase n=1 Tax=Cephus cinctus TaxID=211228 RepID=A0AAJ7RKE1_CEPCN|nr:dihydroxyacetone phosphate acyltransferase [Cephus cinctus]XP_024942076.1 dihydroxyacetone phosphate acyltransferase [Cephus cinctus]XP_024942077.1 dihydroxyacetone phosphate acyltransferase [Cephus cinctus]
MQKSAGFVDLLGERRKDNDIMWVSRPMNPLLPHKLPPECKYSRKQAIEAALSNPRVELAIESLALAKRVDKSIIRKEARDMLEEMASKAHLPTVRWIGLLITKVLKRILLSIRINQSFLLQIRGQMRIAQVQYVYAPTHRSYLDFILLSYILFSYDMALPNIASGMDFYRMRVVGELLRKTGAFYMRRSFSTDILYKEIFRAYVASLVEHSDRAIEFFIEGTRSRSQKSIAPKFGLLAMILEGLFRGDVPDICFIPINITYDRPLEELLFAYELLGVPKPAESTSGLFRSLSILKEPFAHGHVYMKIAAPISAREFFNLKSRRISALSPHSKLPAVVVKRLGYAIIESHKKCTTLTPFNIIAILFNEKVHSCPEDHYTINTLLDDYHWLKELLSRSFSALTHPSVDESENDSNTENEKRDILESLNTHRELLAFDTTGKLRLKERHKNVTTNRNRNVKGHLLSETTMRLVVPAINIGVYLNPVFAFITVQGMIVLSIWSDNAMKDQCFERYFLLRSLLSNEFAMTMEIPKTAVISEWENGLSVLSNENCVFSVENKLIFGSNTKLRSILKNLLLPYIAAIRVTCILLSEWDNDKMGEPTERQIIKESQKKAENLMFNERKLGSYPYSLSIDLYSSTLVSLVAHGAVKMSERSCLYSADKIQLTSIIKDLDVILEEHHPSGSYLDIFPSISPQSSISIQAKL